MKRLAVLWIAVIVSGCRMIDWIPSVRADNRLTATITPRPTFTPRPTDTPWPTFTPRPTVVPVTPGVVSGVISATVNVRLGPGTNYPVVTKLKKDARIDARGRDLENEWLFLVPPPNGWVNAGFVSLSGDVNSLPVIEAPPTPAPTPTPMTPMLTWTPAPTPTPQMYVDFRADAVMIFAGACTTLRWDVEGVRAVYLDGRGQPGHGSQEVCPSSTRVYALHVVLNSGGYVDRGITVAVYPAPPTATLPRP